MMLDRWRSNPISFIETVLYDPETKKPFKLLPAERAFLEHAFKRDDIGHLLYPEQFYSCPKKVREDDIRGHSCADDAAAVRWQPILRRRFARTIRNKASVACSR